jgi:hypothetical protein
MLEGRPLGNCLLSDDYTGRPSHEDKSVIAAEVSEIPDRPWPTAESWWSRLEKLSRGRLFCRFFADTRKRRCQFAHSLGVHHLDSLGRCPT